MAYFDNLRLDKGMYKTGRPFTAVLEEMDPSANYEGTELGGLDAYERQLKRFDIKVSGPNSDVVEKFFRTSESAALFPEYVARAVRAGMEQNDILPAIVATTTRIEGMDYRTITSVPGEEEKELKKVAEGAVIPSTLVKTQENLVRLHKRGRMLVSSYEALRFQRLDLFTVMLKQIGANIATSQLKDAVDVLIKGDGNGNGAEVISFGEQGKVTYTDLINLWSKFDPYNLTTILVSPDIMLKLLEIEEFKNPATGLNFQATGKLTTPLGAQLIRTSALPDGTMIGLDKNCALEKVQAGDVMLEYDKLIDRQLERTAITAVAGFAKIFPDAVKVME